MLAAQRPMTVHAPGATQDTAINALIAARTSTVAASPYPTAASISGEESSRGPSGAHGDATAVEPEVTHGASAAAGARRRLPVPPARPPVPPASAAGRCRKAGALVRNRPSGRPPVRCQIARGAGLGAPPLGESVNQVRPYALFTVMVNSDSDESGSSSPSSATV